MEWILDDARRNGYPPGQQRAFVMAKVLEQHPVIIVGADHPEIIAAAKMIPAADHGRGAGPGRRPRRRRRPAEALIVPHALLTLPVLTRDDGP